MNGRERAADMLGALTFDALRNGPQYFQGYRIIVTPDRPQVQLSERVKEVLAPEHIAYHNAWLLEYFGTWNALEDGVWHHIDYDDSGSKMLIMNPRTYAKLQKALQ